MGLLEWWRRLPLGVKIFFILSALVLVFTLVPSPFVD